MGLVTDGVGVICPFFQKGLEVCYCPWGVPSRPSPGSYPGPVLCFTVFRTHPGAEVGAIPASPGPILLPSVPYRIGPGRAETDFLATSDFLCISSRFFNAFFRVFLRFSSLFSSSPKGQGQTTAKVTAKMGNFTPTPSAPTPCETSRHLSNWRFNPENGALFGALKGPFSSVWHYE